MASQTLSMSSTTGGYPSWTTNESRYKRRKSSSTSSSPHRAPKPSKKKNARSPNRLRAILFRLLFLREPAAQSGHSSSSSSSRDEVPAVPIAQTPPAKLATLPSTKDDVDLCALTSKEARTPSPVDALSSASSDSHASFLPEINFSKPLRRPPHNPHRHSTYRDLDDARSTAYRSDASSDTSETQTAGKSITSHDSGFFEALEFSTTSRLLAKFQNHSPKSSLSRSTSASTIYYPPASHHTITATQHDALLRRLAGLRRVLAHQEALTSRLSRNLAHLFGIKERQIVYLRGVSDDAKERAIVALTRLRYLVGKAMVRKVVLGKRGGTILTFLEAHLHGTAEDVLDTPLEMMKGKIGSLSAAAAKQKSNKKKHAPTTTIAPRPTPTPPHRWDLKKIEESFVLLREDLDTQAALDEALRLGILGPVRNFRYYKMAVQERVQMRQFAQFVEEELARFKSLYARWDHGLTAVDRVLGGGGVA